MMKKTISLFFPLMVFIIIAFSCDKSNTEKIINHYDTIVLKDTIYLHDTIQSHDTLFIYDSIIHFDTIVLIDTVIIHDTSEFDYLFKHYELGRYELLFYTINQQKDPYKICRMYSDAHEIDYLEEGFKVYPVWSPDSEKFVYIDLGNLSIVEEDIENGSTTELCPIDRNIMFLRYFYAEDQFLVSYYEGDLSKIGVIDYQNNTFKELTASGVDERNPTCSEVDDWIYFSRLHNETFDIYRKKSDGSLEEEVYIDSEFNLSTFSVSADGKFLITPKHQDGKGFIVFYDVENHQIIHELELPVEGHPLYATLSRDNRAIFFVNGTPYNFSEPRNIYRMGLDRTQLFKMTNFEDLLAIRPLVK